MLVADYESRSDVDLRKHGGRRYVEDGETSILCGVAFDTESRRLYVWSPFPEVCTSCCDLGLGSLESSILLNSDDPPPELLERLDAQEPVVGHNCWAFDALLSAGLGHPWNWVDSLPRVRRLGLPGSLDQLGAMFYGVPKDPRGQRALKMCMKPSKKGWVDVDAHRLTNIIRYCARDVVVLAQLWQDLDLGAPHVDDPVLEVHRAINERGIRVDVEAAKRIEAAERELTERAVAESPVDLRTLNSPKALCKWLKSKGVRTYAGHYPDDVTEPTVRRLLELTRDEEVRAALQARLRVATVTGGKIRALLNRVCADGRLRDTTAYFAAHTGRWGGRGFQVQNLPRAEAPKDSAWDPDVPLVRANLDDSAQQMQAMLRGVLVGDPWLVVCDLSQIEYRVLRWLVGDEDALSKIRGGTDPYQITADRMNVERSAGKVVELAAGYGGGLGSLETWSTTYDVWFDDPQGVIEGWRDTNPLIAGKRTGSTWINPDNSEHVVAVRKGGFWRDTQRAAWDAVTRGGDYEVGRVVWRMVGRDLHAELPSGRSLRYRNAAIEDVPNKWSEELKPALCFDAARSGRESTYGGRLVENCVQAVARDVFAGQLVELERAGLKPVFTVHDEAACETDNVAAVEQIMAKAPAWARDLPVAAEAKKLKRYEK